MLPGPPDPGHWRPSPLAGRHAKRLAHLDPAHRGNGRAFRAILNLPDGRLAEYLLRARFSLQKIAWNPDT
jgi:hypothetical protein